MGSNLTAPAEYFGSSGISFPGQDVIHFGEARVDVAAYG